MRQVPSSVLAHYERCAVEVDEVHMRAFQNAVATHNLQLSDEEGWLRHPMYREIGRPAGVVHYLATPVVAGGDVRVVLGVARRRGSPAFNESDRCLAMTVSMHASAAMGRLDVLHSGSWEKLERLTRRQRAVAFHVARGLGNKEIAVLLGVSVNTVKAHLKDIFGTVEIEARAELAAMVACAPRSLLISD
jgi:DNA-binding CsgD family transcriptional regulator